MIRYFFVASLIATTAACSKLKVESLTPSVTEGSFVSEDSSAIVPVIVITKDHQNDLSTYVLTSYTCSGVVTSRFESGGIVFASTTSSVPSPSIYEISRGCNVETNAAAVSNGLIKVDVKINGVPQKPSLLRKAEQSTALLRVQTVEKSSNRVVSEEKSCHTAFSDLSCSELGLESR